MIVAVSVDVRLVAQKGSFFQWPSDCRCPRCGGKTWGHGRVARIFEEVAEPVLVPRRRCPGCRCVVTLRPSGYRCRIRSSLAQIAGALRHRLAYHRWPEPRLRQRYGHWLRRLELWRRFVAPAAGPLDFLNGSSWSDCFG